MALLAAYYGGEDTLETRESLDIEEVGGTIENYVWEELNALVSEGAFSPVMLPTGLLFFQIDRLYLQQAMAGGEFLVVDAASSDGYTHFQMILDGEDGTLLRLDMTNTNTELYQNTLSPQWFLQVFLDRLGLDHQLLYATDQTAEAAVTEVEGLLYRAQISGNFLSVLPCTEESTSANSSSSSGK